MLAPFETVDAPRINDIYKSVPLFRSILSNLLPVFVIANVDPSQKLENVLSPVRDLIDSSDLVFNPTDAQFDRKVDGEADTTLHIDGEYGDWIDLSLHRTHNGQATAFFIETQGNETSAISARELPEDAQLMKAGLLNTDFFAPLRHVVEVRAHDLVVFRRGGIWPVAHMFVTTQRPRYSKVERLHSNHLNIY